MMEQFDVIVIGSGLAGMTVAYSLNHVGKKVAVVEQGAYGGVVENSGSTRKKELATVALTTIRGQRLAKLGIQLPVVPKWTAAMEWVNQLENNESDDVQNRFEENGIVTITGHAHFLTNQVIEVAGKQYSASQFVIATGAKDRIIHCTGEQYLQSSADFLTRLKMPNDITIIGAGIIAFAFITIATAFGIKVHVLQHNDRALAAFDQEMVNKLITYDTQAGVDFHFNDEVRTIQKVADHYIINTKMGTKLVTGAVFRAAGRVPNVEDLGLDQAGVEYDQHGIIVDQALTTTQNNIFACGDCVSAPVPKLTTYAVYQANYLGRHLTGDGLEEIQYPFPVMSTFSQPRLAQVGILINEAKRHPDDYQIETIDMRNWLDQRRHLSPIAQLKLVINRADNKVVGAAAISDDADILINYLTLLLHSGIDRAELQRIIFAYPSMAPDLSRFWN